MEQDASCFRVSENGGPPDGPPFYFRNVSVPPDAGEAALALLHEAVSEAG